MKIHVKVSAFEETDEKTHVIGVWEVPGKKDSFTCSREEYTEILDRLAADDVFKAKKGSQYFVRSVDDCCPHILFVGLGNPEKVTGETLREAGAHVAHKLEGEKLSEAALNLDTFDNKNLHKDLSIEKIAHSLAQGALFSQYSFDHYKSGDKKKPKLETITFYVGGKKGVDKIQKAAAVADAENRALKIARDLSNEPGSHLYPMELAARAQKLAKEYGITCKILDKKTLEKEKMGALLGVGQGSINPPCLIVLEYKPKKAKKTIAFVGKAVTFDSGGISLKPGQGMEEMKHDMSGGADVIAATLLAAELKVDNHIVCVVPAAENMPDGNAIVPSTILTTRAGKTIEVQNTDAEGRLILSDAIDYAQDYEPDVLIDVATLTGAVVLALSSVAAGIMGNDDGAMAKWKAAAAETEERYVELPIFPEYEEDIKSKIADIKNIGGEKGAGSQKGGAFLKAFIKKDVKWIHVDIAGTAWSSGKTPYHPKHGGTGHTVRTLTQFAANY